MLDGSLVDGGSRASEGGLSFQLKKANITYVALFVLVGIVSLVLSNNGSKWLGKIIKTNHTDPGEINLSLVCRTTLASALFFVIHGLVTCGNSNLVDSFQFIVHVSWTGAHWILFGVLWVIFWFIPDGLFNAYLQCAYAAAGIYLFLQIIFLIDFFFELNDKFTGGDSDEPTPKSALAITIAFLLVFLGVFIAAFIVFHDKGQTAKVVASVNLVVCVLLFLAALFIEHGSILTASLVCAYVAFLTFSGSLSLWPLESPKASARVSVVTGIIWGCLVLLWAGSSAFSSSSQFGSTCSCDPEKERPFSLSFFHFFLALASAYLTMLTTNWATRENTKAWAMDRGTTASWVNFASAWLSMALYAWTLIAPLVCRNREFA